MNTKSKTVSRNSLVTIDDYLTGTVIPSTDPKRIECSEFFLRNFDLKEKTTNEDDN